MLSKNLIKTVFSTRTAAIGLCLKLTGDPDMPMTGVWFLFSYNCYKISVCQELGGELPVAR